MIVNSNAILVILIVSRNFANSFNILLIPMSDSDSHWRSMLPLAENLARAGHNVTMFQERERSDAKSSALFNEMRVRVELDQSTKHNVKQFEDKSLWNQRAERVFDLFFIWHMSLNWTRALIEQRYDQFQSIMLNQTWDLMIIDSLYTPTGVALANLIDAPYLLYHTTSVSTMESIAMTGPRPPSYLPSCRPQRPTYNPKNFIERLETTMLYLYEFAVYRAIDEYQIRPLLIDIGTGSDLREFYTSQRLSFVDYPINLDFPMPRTTSTIQLGTRCYEKLENLSPNLEEFVNDPKSRGTIVLAFGHLVQWNSAPWQILLNLSRALNRLHQYKIVWQLNRESSEDLNVSSHVKTMRWIPQASLMKHHKTRLLITQGGVKSLMESVCYGLPTLIIPFTAEQMYNAVVLKNKNFGLILEKRQLYDENAIFYAIQHILRNLTYKNNVLRAKSLAEDSIISAAEIGKFWTEFSIRRRNVDVSWLRLQSVYLNLFVYNSIDVFVFFSTLFLVFLASIVKVIKLLDSLRYRKTNS